MIFRNATVIGSKEEESKAQAACLQLLLLEAVSSSMLFWREEAIREDWIRKEDAADPAAIDDT